MRITNNHRLRSIDGRTEYYNGMSGAPLRAALIGYGYWGPNLLRNLLENSVYEVTNIVDGRDERLIEAKRVSVKSNVALGHSELNPSDFDCVFIATPPETHFGIAKYFIEKGKHVWIEKPAVTSMREYLELKACAEEHQVTVFVDHTFCFSPVVRELKRRIEKGEFGPILHVNSLRANLGIFQTEVNALFDLAIHDLAIIDFLFPESAPVWVVNLGFDPLRNGQTSINTLVVQYQNGLSASIQVNWISPVKKREFFVIGQKQAAIYDETDQNHKLKVFHQEFTNPDTTSINTNAQKTMLLTSYKTGDLTIPKIANVEALRLGVHDFAQTITTGKAHCCEIRQIHRIMSILEAGVKSAELGGMKVEL
jgi:predicted dehydrogenase